MAADGDCSGEAIPGPSERYRRALEFIFERVNFEREPADASGRTAWKLERMSELLERLGNPQLRIPAWHVAGTKGKGSTAAMLTGILRASGVRTGLYTSPHLDRFEERMQVDGQSPGQDELVALVDRLRPVVAQMDALGSGHAPTYFELATAMAWLYFVQRNAERVVLEVGIGGRLDATNLCRPELCVVTSISRDHTRLLGESLAEIAAEKAGIIKPGVPVISGVLSVEPRDVIRATAAARGCGLWELDRDIQWRYQPTTAPREDFWGEVSVETPWALRAGIPLAMAGRHQAANAALAVTGFDCIRQQTGWSADAVERGLPGVRVPVRIEMLRSDPTVLIDAAHNRASAAALTELLDEYFSGRPRTLIFAGARDKDLAAVLNQLGDRFDRIVLTEFQENPRAAAPEELAALLPTGLKARWELRPTPAEAWKTVSDTLTPRDVVVFAGSFYLAAEARRMLSQKAVFGSEFQLPTSAG